MAGAGAGAVGVAGIAEDDSVELAALEDALVTLEDMICEYVSLIHLVSPSLHLESVMRS